MYKKNIGLKFLLVLSLMIFQFIAQPSPAAAYCVENKTTFPLRVQLETYSALGEFKRLLMPGKTACCDWFDRSCNPTAKRDGLLTFSARTEIEAKQKLYCSDGGSTRIYGVGNGTITILETATTIGGLACDSRDAFLRPINKLTIGTILQGRGRRPLPMIRLPGVDEK
jgi:hypothetical protein